MHTKLYMHTRRLYFNEHGGMLILNCHPPRADLDHVLALRLTLLLQWAPTRDSSKGSSVGATVSASAVDAGVVASSNWHFTHAVSS